MRDGDFRLHLEVETPEQVVLDYEIAGLGSRALAATIDLAIVIVLIIAEIWLGVLLGTNLVSFTRPLALIAVFATFWGYFTLSEGFGEGRTPGKRWMGLRVIRDTGHPIGFREAAARNLLRIADYLPPPYLLGGLFVAIHPKAKRLGDLVAGTVVVRDRPIELPAPLDSAINPSTIVGSPLLSTEDYALLREFVSRTEQLVPEVRDRLAAQLTQRFSAVVPDRREEPLAFLQRLDAEETSRRQTARATHTGGLTGAQTLDLSQQLAARKDERWRAFDRLAERATKSGLNSFAAEELPLFAASYREVAADLARLRTYHADPRMRARVERLVAAGHNALYRADRHTWRAVVRYFTIDAPSAVIEARRAVTIAFCAFALPAIAGYATIQQRPQLAETIIPPVMIDRAQTGKKEQESYARAKLQDRPTIAAAITTNNLVVSFVCFATGIFFGVGSLVALASNGLLLGLVSGYFHNEGVLGYLWTFVAGHGVLELFAIWCAGAAGFLLGSALVRPGNVSRKDALVLNGRLAMRLVSLAFLLLLVAGTIEGFLSTSGASTSIKVAVSIVSAGALATYLYAGHRGAKRLSGAYTSSLSA